MLERPFGCSAEFAVELRACTHGEGDVDRSAVFGIERAERRRHAGSPIAALRDVTVVAEARHEFGESCGDLVDAPAGDGRLAGEPVPGQRGRNDVERIRCIATVIRWVGEWFDHLVELDNRARPSVREQQGSCMGMR